MESVGVSDDFNLKQDMDGDKDAFRKVSVDIKKFLSFWTAFFPLIVDSIHN